MAILLLFLGWFAIISGIAVEGVFAVLIAMWALYEGRA